jgi:hypothetical protein
VKTKTQPNRRQGVILRQICELIPTHLVAKLARETGVDEKARTFTPWSHVVALLYGQLSHATGLNDVCDALQLQTTLLSSIRGATPPSKNAFSHANRERPCTLAERLFWVMLEDVQQEHPAFGQRGRRRKLGWRFKRALHVIDSTTIQLVANAMDWAKHRRRKAAAKCHVRLELQSMLPRFAIVATALEHDNTRAREVCAGLRAGEVAIFDKAYLDFEHLSDLNARGIWWVTRAKDYLSIQVKERRASRDQRIIADEVVVLSGPRAGKDYPTPLRRVTAWVEVDGAEREMVFLSNHLDWSAASIVELYGCRWEIETFFKELKQTVQLVDFLGHSENAVKWQVWTALLVHLLLRLLAWQSRWSHSFSRLVTFVRAALWLPRALGELLRQRRCGTAAVRLRWSGAALQTWLPGLAADAMGQHA